MIFTEPLHLLLGYIITQPPCLCVIPALFTGSGQFEAGEVLLAGCGSLGDMTLLVGRCQDRGGECWGIGGKQAAWSRGVRRLFENLMFVV